MAHANTIHTPNERSNKLNILGYQSQFLTPGIVCLVRTWVWAGMGSKLGTHVPNPPKVLLTPSPKAFYFLLGTVRSDGSGIGLSRGRGVSKSKVNHEEMKSSFFYFPKRRIDILKSHAMGPGRELATGLFATGILRRIPGFVRAPLAPRWRRRLRRWRRFGLRRAGRLAVPAVLAVLAVLGAGRRDGHGRRLAVLVLVVPRRPVGLGHLLRVRSFHR